MATPTQRLEIRQSQSLVMTPQLQQSLKMLQYSSQELAEYIESQLEKNPLLTKEGQEEQVEDNQRSPEETQETPEAGEASVEGEMQAPEEDGGLDINHDNQWDEKQDWNQDGSSLVYDGIRSGKNNFDDEGYDLEQMVGEKPSLYDHLKDQIYLDIQSSVERLIAVHLLDGLDEAGYFKAQVEEMAQQLNVEPEAVEVVLKKMQKLDPPGIFARGLKECLAIQLKDKNRYDPAMQKLVENLELMASGEIAKLEKICQVNSEDMKEMLAEIRALNPRPCSDFEKHQVEVVRPDVFVRKSTKDGTWLVELNNETLPRVLVNKRYYAEVKKRAKSEGDKRYLSEQISEANWLVKTLHQRAETILKVASELVVVQQEFFEKGVAHLKPLTLKAVAEKLDVHESTVGRVTTSKYIATPSGIYEMKFFFSSSLQSTESDGDDVSSTAVKHLIKQLIDEENPKKILSDDKLVDLLTEKGINVARRTVAKYREALHIPSSVERRRLKRMQG